LLEIPPSAIVELAGARVIQVPKKPVEGS